MVEENRNEFPLTRKGAGLSFWEKAEVARTQDIKRRKRRKMIRGKGSDDQQRDGLIEWQKSQKAQKRDQARPSQHLFNHAKRAGCERWEAVSVSEGQERQMKRQSQWNIKRKK